MRIWTLNDGPEPVHPDDLSGISWEVIYDNDLERGKRTTRDYPHSFLRDDDSGDWSQRTGIPSLERDPTLHGGGLQILLSGGRLGLHLDYDHSPVVPARRRALSVVAFLNPEWREGWGGALVFATPEGRVVRRIYPAPNLVVAFECTDLAYHGVEEVTGPVARVTLAKSFLVPAGRTRALFIPNRG